MRRELVVLFALAACGGDIAGPPSFDATELPIEWKPVLERNFREIEACSGLRADFDKLRTYFVDAGALLPYFPPETGAAFYAPVSIYIERDDWSILLLRHEYLHYILSANKIKDDHNPLYFKERCGGLVS